MTDTDKIIDKYLKGEEVPENDAVALLVDLAKTSQEDYQKAMEDVKKLREQLTQCEQAVVSISGEGNGYIKAIRKTLEGEDGG